MVSKFCDNEEVIMEKFFFVSTEHKNSKSSGSIRDKKMQGFFLLHFKHLYRLIAY